MRIFMRKLTKSDPTMFVFCFGVWSIVCGVTLLFPGNIFEVSPVWKNLQLAHADDNAWGWAMLIDGVLQVSSIRMRRIPHRAAIAATSAIMWFPIGVAMCLAAHDAGYPSIVGLFSLCGAAGSLLAVEQWVHNPDRVGGSDGVR